MEMITLVESLSLSQLEKGVVCSLLQNPNSMPDVAPWLTPEMFYDPDVAFIYQALLRQYDQGLKPDLLDTEAEMRRMDMQRYERIGGVSLLGGTVALIHHGGNLTRYATEIKRLYTLRLLEATFRQAAIRCGTPQSDPLEVIGGMDEIFLNIRKAMQDSPLMRALSELALEAIEKHRARIAGETDDRPVLTGLSGLDMIFGGLHHGELYILAGRPGVGKTAIALHMAMGAASRHKGVSFFSMEMLNQELMDRLFAGHAGINASLMRTSALDPEHLQTMDEVARSWEGLPLYFDYTPGNTVQNIRAQVLLQKKTGPCNLIVIDYLHLLYPQPTRGETTEQVVSQNVQALKRLALEANCAVLALSQMNRQNENRPEKNFRPRLSDLRASGMIEQAADGVIFIYRPELYGITRDEKTGESLVNTCDLIVSKNRHGRTGEARIRHNGSFTLFKDNDDKSPF